MIESIVPMIIMTGMFAMIFGIVYVRSRENMALIEKGLNPRLAKATPRPYISLKYGLLLIGCGLGLLTAYIVDHNVIDHSKSMAHNTITIGGHHSKGKNRMSVTIDAGHAVHDTSVAAQNAAAKNDSASAGNDDDNHEDEHSIAEIRNDGSESVPIYFALIAIGGGLGLFFSYRIEKKEWLDKRSEN